MDADEDITPGHTYVQIDMLSTKIFEPESMFHKMLKSFYDEESGSKEKEITKKTTF